MTRCTGLNEKNLRLASLPLSLSGTHSYIGLYGPGEKYSGAPRETLEMQQFSRSTCISSSRSWSCRKSCHKRHICKLMHFRSLRNEERSICEISFHGNYQIRIAEFRAYFPSPIHLRRSYPPLLEYRVTARYACDGPLQTISVIAPQTFSLSFIQTESSKPNYEIAFYGKV